jgi:hypothetical protein
LNYSSNDKYYFNQSYLLIGNYSFYIWAKDFLGNTNKSELYNFTIIADTIPPEIINIEVQPNIQYENYPVNISCEVSDNVEVNMVMVNITDPLNNIINISMTKVDNYYFYQNNYSIIGNHSFFIWTNDTLGNINCSEIHFFNIIPIIPKITEVKAEPNPQYIDGYVNISCKIVDNTGINSAKINITGPLGYNSINETMTFYGSDEYYFNINYSVNGTYTYFIWAKDTDGYSNISSLYTFEIINQTSVQINLSFLPGWNLITIPLNNSMWASDIADNLTGCTSISRWDAVNQTYKTYIVGGPPTFDFPIKPGCGYFVDMTSSDNLSLFGPLIYNVSINLKIGWNLLGWYHSYNTTASSLAGNITSCNSVSMWNTTVQTYDTYIVGGPPTFDFTITCGMGVFVDVSEESVWYGGG